jgi:parvulin-like peptidyl-prolyl isomerase
VLEIAAVAMSSRLSQNVVDAVFAAAEGDVVGPLEAVDGWHILKVERLTPAPTPEEALPRVRRDLAQERVRLWRQELRLDATLRVAPDLSPQE